MTMILLGKHFRRFLGQIVVRGDQAFVAEGLESLFQQFEFLELISITGGFDRGNESVDGLLLIVARVRDHMEKLR